MTNHSGQSAALPRPRLESSTVYLRYRTCHQHTTTSIMYNVGCTSPAVYIGNDRRNRLLQTIDIYNMSIVCNNLFHFDLCCVYAVVYVVVYVVVDVDVVSLVYIDIVLKTTAVALEIRSRYCTSSRIRAFLSFRSLHYFQFLNTFSAFKSIIFWTQSTQTSETLFKTISTDIRLKIM